MSRPVHVDDVLRDVATRLLGLVWAEEDSLSGDVFKHITAPGVRPTDTMIEEMATNVPAAVVFDGGSRYPHPAAMIEAQRTRIGIVVIASSPRDQFGEADALDAGEGLYAVFKKVLNAFFYIKDPVSGDAMYLTADSAPTPIKSSNGGLSYKVLEVVVEHLILADDE
ncbi:MAG: hypothetical protein AB7F99_09515 [Vicinamibacterales bacterium]